MALLVMLTALLSGCAGGVDTPFAKSGAAPGAALRAPPVLITALDGLPQDKAAVFADQLVAAAAPRDITVLKGRFARGLSLAGGFTATGATLSYSFVLTGPGGEQLMQISADEPAADADGWRGASPLLLQRVAAFTAESLASRMLQLGFAAQGAGLPPPPDGFARPGPGAAQEIDLETLYGPDAGPSVPPPDVVAAAPPATPAKPAKPGAAAITAIALLPVEGAPGTGNAELRAAMKDVLTAAGWPVIDAPRADALSVKGRVGLSPPSGGSQRVILSWQVSLPSGADAGTVKQDNQVPAGSLDRGWGPTARYAAEAAAGGLFDLVGKLR